MRKPAQSTTDRLNFRSAGAETPQAKRRREQREIERREAAEAEDKPWWEQSC
jgi:hypothetical protein